MYEQAHTEICKKITKKQAEEYKTYIETYPNYCKTCQGSGGLLEIGSYWQPDNWEPCDDCVGQGRCPQCGYLHQSEADFMADLEKGNERIFPDDFQQPLTCCGWAEGDGCPHPPEWDYCNCPWENNGLALDLRTGRLIDSIEE